MFSISCLDRGWYKPGSEPSPLSLTSVFLNRHLHKLIHVVFADYARSLKTLGFKQGAILFASKAGASGKDLLNELKQPEEEVTEE